ncbi:hypothetical protein LSG31_00730 [Fodinisporobacter ferrooxydans]|uniref:Uncharacterized protein n=1 Tax=Fodinisporobacter ferrooxydans TaxID=2901836 RepID=A0ABY4CNR8_9BACL|nr:hypothetical protein LSG31_00730 [Alicyclobacillaceae bacterium MYW30-H2]
MDVLKVLESQIASLEKSIAACNDFKALAQLHAELTRCIENYARIKGMF